MANRPVHVHNWMQSKVDDTMICSVCGAIRSGAEQAYSGLTLDEREIDVSAISE